MSVRDKALSMIDHVPPLRQAVLASANVHARRSGADREMLGLINTEKLALDRALQAIQWTAAIGRRSSPPRHFQPGDHFTGAATRRRARILAGETGDERFTHGLITVADHSSLDDLASLVKADLGNALTDAALRPTSRTGTDPSAQRSLVAAVHQALTAVAVRPFLMSGSLLGVIRDGDFMAQDYDVDLGLLPGSDTESAESALRSIDGAAVERVGARFVVKLDGVTADVFEHEERSGRWWHSTLVHDWWNTPFGLVAEDRTGLGFWIPDDPERYLTENYGDWSRPVPFYEISFDTPNREYRRDIEALRFLHSRVRIGLRTRDRWLVESAARELRDAFDVDVTHLLGASPLTR